MGREYSNKRSSRARSSAPHQFLVVIITFLLGYLTATVFDIETITRWVNAQVLAHNELNKTPDKPQAPAQAAIPPKPKFEFYTLLANENVPNSQPAARPAANQAAATTTAAPVNAAVAVQTAAVNTATVSHVAAPVVAKTPQPAVAVKPAPVGRGAYSVQVASFKTRQDAEHMKGLLILKGFNVTIVPISHASRGNWFRVVVGPYANRTLAQNAQMDLARNQHLRGMLVAG